MPNNKALFVWSFLYFLALLIFTKSIFKTFFYSFFIFSLLNIGQMRTFVAIPAANILGKGYERGRLLEFIFSPRFVFGMTATLVLVIKLIQNFYKKCQVLFSNYFVVFLLISIFFSLMSSWQTLFFPTLSIFRTLGLFFYFSLIVLLWIFYREQKKGARLSLLNLFLSNLLLVSIFESCLVFIQFLIKKPLGILIEISHVLPTFGFGADQELGQFRPIGLTSHANMLANHFLTYLISASILSYFLYKIGKLRLKKSFIFLGIFLIVLVLLLTQSRAIYISIFIFFSTFMAFNRSILENAFLLFNSLKKRKWTLVFLSTPILWLVFKRIIFSLNTFTDKGGALVRNQLFEEALIIFKKNPWFGVGSGMYIPAAFYYQPEGVSKFFPEAVHNGFLLMLVQNGLFVILFIILAYCFLFKNILSKVQDLGFRMIIIFGFVSQFMAMLFHPFSNIFSLYTLINLLIIYEYRQNKKIIFEN